MKNLIRTPWLFLLVSLFTAGCSVVRRSRKSEVSDGLTYRWILKDTVLDRSSLRSRLNASEPHITVSRRNPAVIVGGSILDNVYITRDTGRTWQHRHLASPLGVYGDPVLLSGNDGRIYYFHLASGRRSGGHWLEAMVLQYSDDDGETWSPGTAIGQDTSTQQDKPWPALNPRTGQLALAWTQFDRYGSKDPHDRSRILVSFSSDRGEHWTPPVRINDTDGDCLDDDNTVEGATLAFGKDHRVYAVWAYRNRLWFDYSADGGKTWHRDRPIARQALGWNFDIDGLYRANGLPFLLTDRHENLYVVYGDYNDKTGGDIHLLISRNRGKTWKEYPLPVPTDRDQFFPAAAMDPVTGRLVILYYDRSRTRGRATDVRLLVLSPGNGRYSHIRLNRESFSPVKTLFFGDYVGVDAYHGIVAAIWTGIRNFGTQVHVAILKLNSSE